MKHRSIFPCFRPAAFAANRQRGAIFFLVLALLSIVVMVALTMLFVSRLETLASHNAGLSVQSRMAVVSGVAAAARILPSEVNRFASLAQPWARGWSDALIRPETADGSTSTGVESLARILALDESSRINLNTVAIGNAPRPGDSAGFAAALPRETFQRFLAARLAAAGLEKDMSSAIATHVLQLRLGKDGKPDPQIFVSRVQNANPLAPAETPEPAAPLADLRRKPETVDDLPIRDLEALRSIPGMTENAFNAVAPFLTTYSSAPELWYGDEGEAYVKTSLNTSSLEEIHATLAAAYPGANPYALQQFAVNIVDRRDTDTLPTIFPGGSTAYPVLGAENTPVISEVCPDVSTFEEDDDNGEYIEIYNPLPQPVSLRGWRIDWGAGEQVLNEVLPAGGFLILTDDIKNDNDPTPEVDAAGMGSFYDVFRILPTGAANQAVEILSMDIPNDSGLVQLLDGRGNLIDYLAYKGGTFNGMNRGFQKKSPFARMGEPGPASPFKTEIGKPAADYAGACRNILQARMNRPFSSPAEVLAIPTEYLMLTGTAQRPSEPWSFPLLADSRGQGPDLRLLDLFTIQELPGTNRLENDALKPWDPENGPRALAGYPEANPNDLETSPMPIPMRDRYRFEPVSFGKINLNTALPPVLEILPGMNPGLMRQILQVREQTMAEMVQSAETGADWAPFKSLADFALHPAVWENVDDRLRLQTLLFLSPLVTCNSSAFRVSALNTSEPAREGRRPSRAAAQALVHVGPGGSSILAWNFEPIPPAPKAPAPEKTVPEPTAEPRKPVVGKPAAPPPNQIKRSHTPGKADKGI